jgi:hypothetical protein
MGQVTHFNNTTLASWICCNATPDANDDYVPGIACLSAAKKLVAL